MRGRIRSLPWVVAVGLGAGASAGVVQAQGQPPPVVVPAWGPVGAAPAAPPVIEPPLVLPDPRPLTPPVAPPPVAPLPTIPVGQPAAPAPPPPPAEPKEAAKPAAGAPADADAVRKIVADYLKEQEAKKKEEEERKKKEADAQGYVVGSNLTLQSFWNNNPSTNGLFFQTPNKDWVFHFGGRFQFESVFWSQPARLKGPAPGNGGVAAPSPGDGVGPLDDGMFFRRVRLKADGTAYELVEFNFEVDFEQLNFITWDHMWVGFKDLPILGTVRVGQQKVPQGLESMSSDYHLQLLERSSLTDAFWTLFAPGVLVANTLFDQHVTYQTMFHRVQPLQFYNLDFGDGDYAETSRVTWTPVYAGDGTCVVHIGGSYQWRHGDLGRSIQPGGTGNTFADTQSAVRFRARPELRDATGIGTTAVPVLGGDTGRFVDTGFLLADDVHTIGSEFLWIQGPFSLQAEGTWAYVMNAQSIYPATAFRVPRGDPRFWGGYVEASYFLTGEHRGYDRRFGTFDRPKVNENFFLVRGEDGRWHYGFGAWQLAYRFSFVDLNDNGINGGQLTQHTVGLNWFFNDNFKLQMQYSNIQRNVITPAVSGTVHGFGMLAQWYF